MRGKLVFIVNATGVCPRGSGLQCRLGGDRRGRGGAQLDSQSLRAATKLRTFSL
jgi:hypothetical protein